MNGDETYLRHILDAVEKIESYVSVGHDAFMAESHWQDAVVRQMEIIGEATKRLSMGLRSKHPQVPWRRIAGLRDVLVHDYMGVDLEAVWDVTQAGIPESRRQVATILSSPENQT